MRQISAMGPEDFELGFLKRRVGRIFGLCRFHAIIGIAIDLTSGWNA
jgi:hypothetical protein